MHRSALHLAGNEGFAHLLYCAIGNIYSQNTTQTIVYVFKNIDIRWTIFPQNYTGKFLSVLLTREGFKLISLFNFLEIQSEQQIGYFTVERYPLNIIKFEANIQQYINFFSAKLIVQSVQQISLSLFTAVWHLPRNSMIAQLRWRSFQFSPQLHYWNIMHETLAANIAIETAFGSNYCSVKPIFVKKISK